MTDLICNVNNCYEFVNPEDIDQWVICPTHKKWCEDNQKVKERAKIGFKNE